MPSGQYLLKNTDGTAHINGVMQCIKEYEVTGSAVTSFDFDVTLDGDNDGGYMIELLLINGASAYSAARLRINGAEWQTTRSYLFQTSSSLLGTYQTAAGSNVILGVQSTAATAKQGCGIVIIPISKSGLAARYCTNLGSRGNDNTNRVERFDWEGTITTPTAATNITSIGITSTVASGLGVGTIGRLYRLNNT